MTKQEFEIGDIVKLKSGGPGMTVQSYDEERGNYTCQWFAGKKLERGIFKEPSLERKAPGDN
ncbi:YodC family protein [Pseudomonas putida]|uniref:YodC family protein n=1 Tax=Pseudomonas putida TaxID=303 RepID=UPI0039059B5B